MCVSYEEEDTCVWYAFSPCLCVAFDVHGPHTTTIICIQMYVCVCVCVCVCRGSGWGTAIGFVISEDGTGRQ